jgi:hypothetical protein
MVFSSSGRCSPEAPEENAHSEYKVSSSMRGCCHSSLLIKDR